MKKNYQTLTYISLLLGALMALTLTACDDKSKSSANAGVPGTDYVIISGQCFDNVSGVPVDITLCATDDGGDGGDDGGDNGNVGNSGGLPGFEFNENGDCEETATGLIYLDTYCETTSGGGGGGSNTPITRYCRGWYFVPGYGNYSIYCSGFNCTGSILIDGLTGQPVYCQ